MQHLQYCDAAVTATVKVTAITATDLNNKRTLAIDAFMKFPLLKLSHLP